MLYGGADDVLNDAPYPVTDYVVCSNVGLAERSEAGGGSPAVVFEDLVPVDLGDFGPFDVR